MSLKNCSGLKGSEIIFISNVSLGLKVPIRLTLTKIILSANRKFYEATFFSAKIGYFIWNFWGLLGLKTSLRGTERFTEAHLGWAANRKIAHRPLKNRSSWWLKVAQNDSRAKISPKHEPKHVCLLFFKGPKKAHWGSNKFQRKPWNFNGSRTNRALKIRAHWTQHLFPSKNKPQKTQKSKEN